jgi:chromate transporter
MPSPSGTGETASASTKIVRLAAAPERVPFREAFWTWVRIAALSFGGPAGQIAVMHRILVEEKHWLSERRFLHALNYCMLLPGPEAHQLAVYIGWLLHRIRGGIVAGTLFILPGLVALGILSWIYAAYGQIGTVQALFFGLKAAVLAVVIEAVLRVGKRALKSPAQIVIAACAFVAIFFFAIPFPILIIAAAIAGLLGRSASGLLQGGSHAAPRAEAEDHAGIIDMMFENGVPAHVQPSFARFIRIATAGLLLWLGPLALLFILFGPQNVFTTIAAFNSKMAVVTFGGAYAVLAYMAQQAIETYHWLKPDEMLVGLGFAETTPGPLISVVQFVGFMAAFRDPGTLPPLLAGTLGGAIAMWSTFVPSFLWIFLGAPYIESLLGNKALSAMLSAITAAVVGVILNLAVWFALHTLFGRVDDVRRFGMILHQPEPGSVNWAAVLLSMVAMLALFRFKLGMIPTLVVCSGLGVLIHVWPLLRPLMG